VFRMGFKGDHEPYSQYAHRAFDPKSGEAMDCPSARIPFAHHRWAPRAGYRRSRRLPLRRTPVLPAAIVQEVLEAYGRQLVLEESSQGGLIAIF
jgi:hypothetical protein